MYDNTTYRTLEISTPYPSNLAKNEGAFLDIGVCTYTFQPDNGKNICVTVIKCYQVLSNNLREPESIRINPMV
jgi:hypothetical protein